MQWPRQVWLYNKALGRTSVMQALINVSDMFWSKGDAISRDAAALVTHMLDACRLNVMEFNKSTAFGPWAVYHVPSGNVYLDKRYWHC